MAPAAAAVVRAPGEGEQTEREGSCIRPMNSITPEATHIDVNVTRHPYLPHGDAMNPASLNRPYNKRRRRGE